jgi:hypothetical protein
MPTVTSVGRTCLLVVAFVVGPALIVTPAAACDLCAIYSATEQRESRIGWRLAVAEQFTSFDTWHRGDEAVANPGEHLNSFITQVVLGYNVTPRLGFQMNVPLISRVYRRREQGGFVHGDESGIGDLSLLGTFVPFTEVTARGVVRLTLLGGLKLPSGDSRRIGEELDESEEVPSGIHGHDLALGSGSVDGIVGAQGFYSWRRLFVTGTIQYLLRTPGSFDYAYANDLIWSLAPGAFVLLRHDATLGVQVELSGETKGNDTLAGERTGDTAINEVFLGPGLFFTHGTSLAAGVNVDVPVFQHNSGLQIVPDYRLRGSVSWQF